MFAIVSFECTFSGYKLSYHSRLLDQRNVFIAIFAIARNLTSVVMIYILLYNNTWRFNAYYTINLTKQFAISKVNVCVLPLSYLVYLFNVFFSKKRSTLWLRKQRISYSIKAGTSMCNLRTKWLLTPVEINDEQIKRNCFVYICLQYIG